MWSLWLSSLLVGYSIIVWRIFGPAVMDWAGSTGIDVSLGQRAALAAIRIFGGGFLLVFFTVHFGMFHFIHSMFLNAFFPVLGPGAARFGPSKALYLTVLHNYWPFVIVMAVAERDAFRVRGALSMKAGGFMAAYSNVLRMHLLIFFFAFAHFAKLENIVTYGIVYGVYFFPWRLMSRSASANAGQEPTPSEAG